MNRFGFDAASFCEEDARQVQALRKILSCTQVHGAKLGADDVTSIVALIWTGHRILGLTIHFLTPILASAAPSMSARAGDLGAVDLVRRVPGHDVRAGGTAGADIMRIAQPRARSMATGTGLLTMSRTGE